jgi:SNF2 family DNA or RNA helicase
VDAGAEWEVVLLVIHGGWLLPLERGEKGQFILWGEVSGDRLKKPRGRPKMPAHAFTASPGHLREALELLVGLQAKQPALLFTVVLPAYKSLPFPSPRLVHDWDSFEGVTPDGPRRFKLEGLPFSPTDALHLLNTLPLPKNMPPDIVLGDDLIFWIATGRLTLEILAGQRYIPAIEQAETETFHAVWKPVMDRPEDVARLSQLVQAAPPAVRACLPIELDGEPAPPPVPWILENFLSTVIDAAVREWQGTGRRPLPGDDVAVTWLNALFSENPALEGPYFSLSSLSRAHKSWVRQLQAAGDANFRTCLRLDVPDAPDQPWPLDFLLQAKDDPSLLVEAGTVWKSGGKTLTYLDRRFDNPQEKLLTALGYASRIFPSLENSLKERRPKTARLNVDEAYTFLREAAPLLEASGFGLMTPPWWNKRGARLGARLKMKTATNPPDVSSGLLSLENLVNFDWEIVLGEQHLSREEFETLVKLKSSLVQIRGQWVALNPEDIEAAIRFWEKRQEKSEMSALEAILWGLNESGEIDGLQVDNIEATGWLGELLGQLKNGEMLDAIPQPETLEGELRGYQARGFSWLAFMRRWGLGACLADDMGLGKTIQAISLLLHERRSNGDVPPALVICPTSVAGNWEREIRRFAPDLRVLIHHGAERNSGDAFLEEAARQDVIITSYGLARRDGAMFSQMQWGMLILDEAQNIKNPAAKQTRSIRQIPARFRLAMTGTPVENRLAELWSIMHFLNPGYMGTQKGFRTDFSLPIERYRDPKATQRLRRMVGPFILRRLKTDTSIIQDLPEKMEMKVYCGLTPEQATLYQAVVEDSIRQMEAAEEEGDDIKRRGLVLSTLMKLKQVCNHPALFLADQSDLADRSGKLIRLIEMLEVVMSVGEQALIFSQFSSMGAMLKTSLQDTFGREVLFLHGGTSRKQREEMIVRFQGEQHAPPIFVLSLKAGGVGLNLTAANHVFHFDRWWNPAVEQQATDRAFRIGQTRDVQVHKYISTGTLEENIDQLIESKRELAESVVSAGEGWLTELSTDALRQVIGLRVGSTT